MHPNHLTHHPLSYAALVFLASQLEDAHTTHMVSRQKRKDHFRNDFSSKMYITIVILNRFWSF